MSGRRVLPADDYAQVRAGLRALLQELPDFEVIAEAGDGLEALRLIGEMKPDLALVDVSMPRLSGLEVARRARRISRKRASSPSRCIPAKSSCAAR